MERYAVYDDNPLAIDYRDFSLLSNSNLKLIAIGMTFKDRSRQKPTWVQRVNPKKPKSLTYL